DPQLPRQRNRQRRLGLMPALTYAAASAFSKGGGIMPEVLERLEQLAREQGNSLQRASQDQDLTGDPQGFLIVTRLVCRFIEHLSDLWTLTTESLRTGGLPAPRLLRICDLLAE